MIDVDGEPRSLTEMRFAVSLLPCAGCRSHDVGEIEFRTGPGVLIVSASCPRCRAARELRYRPKTDPRARGTPPQYHLGGPEPSQIIRPHQLVAELDRLTPTIGWDPQRLAPAAWHAQWNTLDRALTCLTELAKFIPAGGDRIPDAALDATSMADRTARPEKYQRAWITTEHERLAALVEAYKLDAKRIYALEAADKPTKPVRGELSSRSLEAHLQWVRRGRTGAGRLDIANVDVKGVKVGAKDLSGARLDGVVLDRCDVSFSTFERADLTDVSLVQANLGSCTLSGARIVRCDFIGANLGLGKLEDAVIGGGRFDRTYLDRCSFRRAKVDGTSFRDADFGNAPLDGAVFVDCDLRGASFSLRTKGLLGTTEKTRFERCDLRDTKWEARDLDNATFIDCKLHGISGRPGRTNGISIARPDLSPNGDGRTIGRDADVLALWRGEAVDLD